MILDELNEFADALALNTGGAATYLVGDTIDLGAAPVLKDIGNGSPVYLVVGVTTTFTSGGAATVNLQLASDSTANLATSPTVHWQTGALGFATFVAGLRWVIPLPIERRYERHLGILQVQGTAALTAGAIDAFLTDDPVGWYPIADGVN